LPTLSVWLFRRLATFVIWWEIGSCRRDCSRFADVQRAVGPLVTSECNIFALSVKDPHDLPADIRNDLMTLKDAYRTPNTPIETRHLAGW
jgi:hypothetical protein